MQPMQMCRSEKSSEAGEGCANVFVPQAWCLRKVFRDTYDLHRNFVVIFFCRNDIDMLYN